MLAGTLRRSRDTNLVDEVRRWLLARERSMIVVGACAVCLGPVDRYLADLADGERQRTRHLQAAADLAEEAGLIRWQSITRRDLAGQHGRSA